jgi:hypothetical protein
MNTIPPPPPFAILVDTREQKPLPFPIDVPTIRATLKEGDYGVAGCPCFVAEKKDLADLVGTLYGHKKSANGTKLKNLDRFCRELTRIREGGYNRVYIIVTASIMELLAHHYRSNVKPNSVIGLIHRLEDEYGVVFEFFPNANIAASWLADRAIKHYRRAFGLSKYNVSCKPKTTI